MNNNLIYLMYISIYLICSFLLVVNPSYIIHSMAII